GLGVGLFELDEINLFAGQERRRAAVLDFRLLKHLAHDHFDMLVVDLHALQPIDLLDFLDQIDRQLLHALDAQDVVGARVSFDDEVSLLHEITFAHADVLRFRQQILDRILLLVLWLQDHAPLVLVVLAELDIAVGLGEHRAVLGLARLEQLRHPRQTAGDVAGLGAFRRNTREHVARLHFRAVLDRQNRIDGERITRLAVRERNRLALLVDDDDRRSEIRALRTRAPVDDHLLADAGGFVGDLAERETFDDVLVFHNTIDFGQDRQRVRIPFGNPFATLEGLAFVDHQTRAVSDAMRGTLDPLGVDDGDLHVAAHRHQLALRIAHDVAVDDLDLAVVAGLDLRLRRDLRRAADVEGAHRELRTRLADRLGRDNADGLADIDRGAAGKIASVTLAADAIHELAAEHGANTDFLHVSGFDLLRHVLRDLPAAPHDGFAGFGMLH